MGHKLDCMHINFTNRYPHNTENISFICQVNLEPDCGYFQKLDVHCSKVFYIHVQSMDYRLTGEKEKNNGHDVIWESSLKKKEILKIYVCYVLAEFRKSKYILRNLRTIHPFIITIFLINHAAFHSSFVAGDISEAKDSDTSFLTSYHHVYT